MVRSLACAALLFLPSLASARPFGVFVNEVRVDGLKNVNLTGVDVRFDENGDVHITAPHYKVAPVEPPQTQTPTPTPTPTSPTGTRRFFLVALPQNRVGAAQWDIDVYVNQTYVTRLRSREPPPPVDITRYLHAGQNQVLYVAKKETGERISLSADDAFEVQLSWTDSPPGAPPAFNKLSSYRRTGAETGLFRTEFALDMQAP